MRRIITGSALALLLSLFAAATEAAPDLTIESKRVRWNAYEFRVGNATSGAPLAVLWRFGDGVISGDRAAYHVFPGAGEYRVVMEVTSPDGRVNRVEEQIAVTFFNVDNPWAWMIIVVLAAGVVFFLILARKYLVVGNGA